MLHVLIRNYRRCTLADIDVAPIALVAGINGAGKTSIVQAARAALTGTAIPVKGVTKSRADILVRSGAPDGRVVLTDGNENVATVVWPKAEATSSGEPPRASAVAAGLVSFPDLDDKERPTLLARYLDGEPTRDDLAVALREAGWDPGREFEIADAQGTKRTTTLLDHTWGRIQTDGWDGLLAAARERNVKLKARWEMATGERSYKPKGADTWTPVGWSEDLSTLTVEQLEAAVAEAKTALEGAAGSQAVDAAERARAEEAAASIPALEERLIVCQDAEREAEAEKNRAGVAVETLAPLPGVSGKEINLACPHCGEKATLKVDRKNAGDIHYGLEKPVAVKPPTKAERDAHQKKQAELAAAATAATQAWRDAINDVTEASAELDRARRQAKWLEENAQDDAGEGDAEDGQTRRPSLEDARQAVAAAEARLEAKRAKAAADAAHAEVKRNDVMIGILGPEGVRKARLARAVAAFNADALLPLTDAAGWPAVEIGEDLSVSVGGWPYALASTSYQWRAAVVLQVALAQRDKSAAVVIDAADQLDARGRNGLFKLLSSAGVRALVCMTINNPTLVPDLAKAKLGDSYWIEDGYCRPLATVLSERHAKAAAE